MVYIIGMCYFNLCQLTDYCAIFWFNSKYYQKGKQCGGCVFEMGDGVMNYSEIAIFQEGGSTFQAGCMYVRQESTKFRAGLKIEEES